MDPRLFIFGIRHHGPGSAASVRQALDAVDPAVVLIEGPPEASDILPLAAAKGMKPPVAILTFPANAPEESRFHPFAEYSPEWQAMLWAVEHDRPARFVDEPLTARPEPSTPIGDEVADDDTGDEQAIDEPAEGFDPVLRDPLTWLASAAGHSDGESWWNSLIEQHVHAPDVFAAIESAMTALREIGETEAGKSDAYLEREERREAHMRLSARKALKDYEGDVAVVCGAWHVPALRRKVSVSVDRATIKGTRAIKASCCWVPWTDTRLAFASGYGAGVISPAWYRHLWSQFDRTTKPTTAVAVWQARAARLLRDEGLGASTSSVIEATRLATTLAAVRGLPVPGLAEMRDASLSALCHGDEIPLRVIEQQLVVGHRVGEVDDNAPQPPLLADLTRQQKKLRLKPEALENDIALDLRSKAGLAKSVLLHRLQLIDVHWGTLLDASAGRGTFREVWRLEWTPELSVALAEAVVHGPTVEQAAAGSALAKGHEETDCGKLADLVRLCLLADLGSVASANIARLQAAAVSAANVFGLARAVVPLVDILRYGTARDMPEAELKHLVLSLMAEVCAGLRHACHGLDEQTAIDCRGNFAGLDRAVGLLQDQAAEDQWKFALGRIVEDEQAAPLLRGFATRLLYDRGSIDAEETAAALSRALSASVPFAEAGAWFEGFINEAGEVLLADDSLFAIVDTWIREQNEDDFVEMLPMLRRAFSTFDAASSRRILDRVGRGPAAAAALLVDDPRAAAAFAAAVPLLKTILGVAADE